MKKAILYARVSSKEQAEHGYSIAAQVELLTNYAVKNDLEIVESFEDQETAKQAGRTHFAEMLRFLKANPDVGIVLCEKTDRLYRNFKDYVALEEFDLSIHLVKENEVLSRESRSHQKFIHGIKVLMAKNYIDNLSEEVKKGLYKKFDEGLWPCLAPPGYTNNKDTGMVEPIQPYADQIRLLFEWYASGNYSLKTLRKVARQHGFIHRKTQRPYPMTTLHRILSNPFYYGLMEWAGRQGVGKHTPLISKALFNRVQAVLSGKHHGTETKRGFAYTGILICDRCGCSITAEIKKGRYVYYHCTGHKGKCGNGYIRQEQLDEYLADIVKAVQIPDDVAKWMIGLLETESHDIVKQHEEHRKSVEQRMAKLLDLKDRAYEDKLNGRVGQDQWDRSSKKWDQEIAEIKLFLQQPFPLKEFITRAEETIELAKSLHTQYVMQNPAEKRKLLQILLSNCTYDRGRLTPIYKKPFDILVKGNENQKWLGSRDSNPDTTVQSRVSCRWTTPQKSAPIIPHVK